MKVSQSRKSTNSIMSNPHFGGVLLKKGNTEMIVPKEWITQDGRIKDFALKKWKLLIQENENKKVV
jgi:hypothetical protein